MAERVVVFVTLGTRGDALPFAGVAQAMQRRGHRTVLLSNANHQPIAERLGVPFVAVSEPERPQVGADMRLFFAEQLLPAFRRIAQEIDARVAAAEAVFVVSRFGNWGAAFACERHRLSYANLLLQPDAIWPQGEPLHPSDLPLVNHFRRDLHLAPIDVAGVLEPAAAKLSFFPEWFAWPESRSPAAGRCLGFPFTDDMDAPLSSDLKAWIAEHGAPIVFALGTGLQDVSEFVDLAWTLQRDTGRPVLVLSGAAVRSGDARLRIERYAAHAPLFRHVAVVVHNGGIGVTAQALRAGVPQVVVPLVWDQPDNARRLAALGAGVVVEKPALTPASLSAAVGTASAIDAKLLKMISAAVSADDAVATAVSELEAQIASTETNAAVETT